MVETRGAREGGAGRCWWLRGGTAAAEPVPVQDDSLHMDKQRDNYNLEGGGRGEAGGGVEKSPWLQRPPAASSCNPYVPPGSLRSLSARKLLAIKALAGARHQIQL